MSPKSQVSRHQNSITSRVNHHTYFYKVTAISDRLFSSFCMDRQHGQTDKHRGKDSTSFTSMAAAQAIKPHVLGRQRSYMLPSVLALKVKGHSQIFPHLFNGVSSKIHVKPPQKLSSIVNCRQAFFKNMKIAFKVKDQGQMSPSTSTFIMAYISTKLHLFLIVNF